MGKNLRVPVSVLLKVEMKAGLLLIAGVVTAVAVIALIGTSDSDAAEEVFSVDGIDYAVIDSTNHYVMIKSTVKSTGTGVFDTSLPVSYQDTDYTITALASGTFTESSFTEIRFSANIQDIQLPGLGGSSIAAFTVDGGNTKYADIDGVLCEKVNSNLKVLRYPTAKIDETFTFNSSIQSIGEFAFSYAQNLREVRFDPAFEITDIPYGAFFFCEKLEKVGFDESSGFNTLPNSLLIISDFAFNDCINLKDFRMPINLVHIGNSAFAYSGCSKIEFNGDITYIGEGAFSSCMNLSEFKTPKTKFTGSNGYVAIDNVLFKDGGHGAKSLLCYPCAKTVTSYKIPDDVSTITGMAFSYANSLKEVTFNDAITSVPYMAFQNCTSLETVNFTQKVSVIEFGAFMGCTNLKNLNNTGGLVLLEDMAFMNTGFVQLELMPSLMTVSTTAFYNCAALTKVTIPDIKVTLDYGIFLGCTNLKTIDILGTDVTFNQGALNVGLMGSPAEITVNVPRDYSLPSNVVDDEYTTLDVVREGEHPYPYENLLGVLVCLLVLVGIIKIIREV